ncbi:D-alanyl-D-alanine carboxypeptidase [Enhygromyxa salina]|uniref:D-alanyl-D-alanine carboxypeptidase n=1 Tax=Enhygromyxa salina TaxID=215803 RepID=A0A0C1ZP37_9BACT|nr:D-alanyl-D-alanine carboxypeptidase/D-alanyl-D-alanine-endopeptidase [Enhygromyxa salina]KIG19289.1 D-alanyl-D-alanine carboxypeptidase [Enhygromyxa salina]
MLRRYSPLFAVFLLSGLLTRAGFAGAAKSEDAPPDNQAPPLALVPHSVSTLLAATVQAERRVPASWPARIDGRLQALVAVDRQPGEATERSLRARIDAALSGLDGRVAVEIRDLDRGEVVLSRDADRALNPASNQKLITAIAAVELLGADYRFETKVLREGDALILRGEGDPDLHVRDLHRLAARVASEIDLAGVRRVIIDDFVFDARTLGPGFRSDGPGESYIAPSGALALDYGTVEVITSPGAYLRPAQIHIEPSGAAIELIADTRTDAGSLEVTTRPGADGRTIVEVAGAIPGGHAPISVRRRVADPGLVAGHNFAQLLAAHTGGPPLPVTRGRASANAELIATHESASLITVLTSALRYSNNFTAEQVLRTLAWRATGEPGTWAAGVAQLQRFADRVSPTRADNQRFVNGSGLSHDGRLSPSFVVDVLSLAQRPGSAAHALLASFAKAGGEGTLHARVPHAGARVLAKTGTYGGASSLSGIVRSPTGDRSLGFSVLVNGGELDSSRAAQDLVVAAILRSF